MSWYRVTFPATEAPDEVELAVEVKFGGLCDAYRGENERVAYVRLYEDTADVMRKQLATWVNQGYLLSFEEK